MTVKTIESAMNALVKEGYLDGHNNSLLIGVINALKHGNEYSANQGLDGVIDNYRREGNKKAVEILVRAR